MEGDGRCDEGLSAPRADGACGGLDGEIVVTRFVTIDPWCCTTGRPHGGVRLRVAGDGRSAGPRPRAAARGDAAPAARLDGGRPAAASAGPRLGRR
eukprot:95576-Prymnesium_polylepis.1